MLNAERKEKRKNAVLFYILINCVCCHIYIFFELKFINLIVKFEYYS
jgi:hypothetical protein